MANLKDSPVFSKYNNYFTPSYAWKNIDNYLPKDKIIWEACMLDSLQSNSPQYLTELGCQVVYDCNMDCLKNQPDNYDLIITNPPFETEIKKKILQRFYEIDKPFIIIMNSMNTYANYIRDIFKDNLDKLQIITPCGKIHFHKLLENGELEYKTNTSFYCIYLCYKMDIKGSLFLPKLNI